MECILRIRRRMYYKEWRGFICNIQIGIAQLGFIYYTGELIM